MKGYVGPRFAIQVLLQLKRILPKTSEKSIHQKHFLSVTWKGISALIDPDEKEIGAGMER